jgi:uncharacterized protein (TIRG00374 family)
MARIRSKNRLRQFGNRDCVKNATRLDVTPRENGAMRETWLGRTAVRVGTWSRTHAKALRYSSAAVGLALLAVMMHRAGPARILVGMAAIGPWFFVALALSSTLFLFNAIGWLYVLHPTRPSLVALLKAYLASDTVNSLTPFLSLGGEPLKILWLRGRVPGAIATASVVSDNIVHAGSAVVFMLGGLLLGWGTFDLQPRLVTQLLAAIAAVGLVSWLLLRLSGRGVATRLAGLAARSLEASSSEGEGQESNLVARATEVDAEIQRFFRTGGWRIGASLLAHLAGRVMGAVEAWVLLAALGSPVSLSAAIFITAIAQVLVNLLFAMVPSQVGVQEATAYVLFNAVGLDPSHAVTLILARRVRGFFWNGVGLIMLARGGPGKRPRK